MNDRFPTRYVGIFTGYFAAVMIVVTAILYFSPWDLPSSIALVISMLAALGTGTHFGSEQGRIPEKAEKRMFGLAASLISVFLPILFFSAFLLVIGAGIADAIPQFFEIPAWVWAVALVFSIGLNYLISSWAFGRGAKNQLKLLEKQAAKGKNI